MRINKTSKRTQGSKELTCFVYILFMHMDGDIGVESISIGWANQFRSIFNEYWSTNYIISIILVRTMFYTAIMFIVFPFKFINSNEKQSRV